MSGMTLLEAAQVLYCESLKDEEEPGYLRHARKQLDDSKAAARKMIGNSERRLAEAEDRLRQHQDRVAEAQRVCNAHNEQ